MRRKKRTQRADQRMKRFPLEGRRIFYCILRPNPKSMTGWKVDSLYLFPGTSRDRASSSWMPRAGAKIESAVYHMLLVFVSRYLKRQSNLILDAKSRSKRGGKRR
jgi:hypothetical protein